MPAMSLLTTAVTSDATGSFTITGDYVCPSSASQLYIVATGGNPGLVAGTNNRALALMAALGSCSLHGGQYTLDPNSFISINEATTVASVYALAAFMGGDATHVGTSSSNLLGLANSFEIVNNLVNTTTGAALAVTPAGNGVAPQATINTLANVLASCVNSNGTGAACSALFAAATPSGGTVPTDTLQAIYNIASHPGSQVSALFGLVAAGAPFQPSLDAVPNDWTVSLAYTTVTLDVNGNGATQAAIAIDASGDAWVANTFTTPNNLASSVSELSSNGTILSGAAGYTGGGLSRPNAVAIDPAGNAWLSNSFVASLTKLSYNGTALSGTSGFTAATSDGLAVDGSGNVWAGHLNKYDNNGNLLSVGGITGGGVDLIVKGISVDNAENVWVASYADMFDRSGHDTHLDAISKFTNAGVALSGAGYVPGGLWVPWSIANDSAGNTWVTDNGHYGVYKVG